MPDDLPPLPKGFFIEPVPNDAAIAWLRDKPAVASSVFKRLLPELKARAIAISGVECASITRDIREAIAKVPAGADWDKEKRRIADALHPFLADPEDPKNLKPARRRAELLLRTHGFQAYAIGQHETMRAQQDVFPWWQYLTMGDELVRPTHSALNKLTLPASSPFWLRHSPPWDWGCRCRKVPLLPEEVDEIRQREGSLPPEAKTVIEGEALRFLETQNKLDRGPAKIFDMTPPSEKGRTGAFLFEPDSLRLTPDQLRGRYDVQTFADFADWAQKTPLSGPGSVTVWEWIGGKPATQAVQAAEAAVVRRLDDLVARVATLETDRTAAMDQVKTLVVQANDAFAKGENAAAMEALKQAAEAQKQAAEILQKQREALQVPSPGKVKLAKMAPSCVDVANEGADLTAKYTHPDLLPTVGVVYSPSRRAYHYKGDIYINARTPVSTVMHEITHATEQQNAEVLKACQEFLKARAGQEKPKTLRSLTGIKGYRADEYAYEDEFKKRGGSHYMGKLYGHATEILTMGIERLHAAPGEFLANDADYFTFLLRTLQKL